MLASFSSSEPALSVVFIEKVRPMITAQLNEMVNATRDRVYQIPGVSALVSMWKRTSTMKFKEDLSASDFLGKFKASDKKKLLQLEVAGLASLVDELEHFAVLTNTFIQIVFSRSESEKVVLAFGLENPKEDLEVNEILALAPFL